MMMVDGTHTPGASVGEATILIGGDGDETITVDDIASWADKASYETLCGISKRVPRLYRTSLPGARS